MTTVAQARQSREVPREQRQPVRPASSHLLETGTPEEVSLPLASMGIGWGVAQQLGVHYSTVSRRLRRFE